MSAYLNQNASHLPKSVILLLLFRFPLNTDMNIFTHMVYQAFYSSVSTFCRICPIDLKEAITSLVFASLRCSDIPELAEIKKHFTDKYGKDFITAAVEIRPDCGVSRMVRIF